MLWGDSHAGALYRGVEHSAKALASGVTQWTSSACPPILNINNIYRPHCADVNAFVLEQISDTKPAVLVIHANWLASLYEKSRIIHFRETISQVSQTSPNTQILIVGGIPQWSPSLPEQFLRQSVPLYVGNRVATDLKQVREYDNIVKTIAEEHEVEFISLLDDLCERENCIAAVRALDSNDAVPLIYDADHLTWAGSVFLGDTILTDRIASKLNASKDQ